MFKIFLSMIICFQISLAQIQVFDSIYKAIPEAQKQEKLTIFFILSNTCPHCHKFMEEINLNNKVLKYLKENFIVAITDISKDGKVPADLPFSGATPTTMILTPNAQLIGEPIVGQIPSHLLLEYLEKIEALRKSYIKENR